MQLDRFTQKAQEAIIAAQAAAQRLDSPVLDAEHILSALVEPDDGVPAETLRRLGVDLPAFRGELAAILARRARIQGGSLSLDPRARRSTSCSRSPSWVARARHCSRPMPPAARRCSRRWQACVAASASPRPTRKAPTPRWRS